ncbi:diguanylate cyclase (GGDEF) domain-containing protein [Treponema bryantii]|uniref:diguanylate cyclase n=1 Tax=Treponema bryantii TaxID=163 RepID=A0A1H9HAL5_9SPIR|nr:GGDEF domain-containing protein [Treponema bryantii]SEQ59375.1 diguanylate cyclase (GGDEF) domain-containing protein [Treponema bryantii]
MCEKFLDYLSKKKTWIFLIMCFMVHAGNSVLFFFVGLVPLSMLNILSTVFYSIVIVSYKEEKDFYIIFTYFEILTFSLTSELFSGGSFFYIFYVVGMISSVYYLLPPKRRMKQIFQGCGIIYAIAIYFIHIKQICIFPEYLPVIDECKQEIGLLNLCITLFTMFYISNLYFFEMNAANEKLTYCSDHDLMTGLFNRRFFEHIMQRNKTENENKYTIAIFDIDDFKKVNDTYGHQAGDAVLKAVSSIIEESYDNEFVTVRWGGEEFVLYMPQTDEIRAYEHLTYLRKRIENNIVEFDNQKIKVTVTVGMCTGTNLTDYELVIRNADDRLYYGKRNGKNCVVK